MSWALCLDPSKYDGPEGKAEKADACHLTRSGKGQPESPNPVRTVYVLPLGGWTLLSPSKLLRRRPRRRKHHRGPDDEGLVIRRVSPVWRSNKELLGPVSDEVMVPATDEPPATRELEVLGSPHL